VGGPAKRRQALQILLRSPGDVEVTKNPPWWTLARVVWALAVMTGILVAAFAWVFVLKRRVRAQMEIIQQKIQKVAVFEERSRIAREFHDTLEQELAGIVMQLDALAAVLTRCPEAALRSLKLVRQMARRSLTEARRSVWDLRSRFLEAGNLAKALSSAAKPLTLGTDVEISVSERGSSRRLPGVVETHLLRIGQEAICNVVKHAHARQIRVELDYTAGANVRLTICDDGHGFDIDNAPDADIGHFGLVGMRERAEKLGGKLSVRSRIGQGTEIVVEAPVDNAVEIAAN
jgi:signal transduction histidine kinase